MTEKQISRAVNIGVRAALRYLATETEISQHQAHQEYGRAMVERALRSGVRFRKLKGKSSKIDLGRVMIVAGDLEKFKESETLIKQNGTE